MSKGFAYGRDYLARNDALTAIRLDEGYRVVSGWAYEPLEGCGAPHRASRGPGATLASPADCSNLQRIRQSASKRFSDIRDTPKEHEERLYISRLVLDGARYCSIREYDGGGSYHCEWLISQDDSVARPIFDSMVKSFAECSLNPETFSYRPSKNGQNLTADVYDGKVGVIALRYGIYSRFWVMNMDVLMNSNNARLFLMATATMGLGWPATGTAESAPG